MLRVSTTSRKQGIPTLLADEWRFGLHQEVIPLVDSVLFDAPKAPEKEIHCWSYRSITWRSDERQIKGRITA